MFIKEEYEVREIGSGRNTKWEKYEVGGVRNGRSRAEMRDDISEEEL